MAAAFSSVMRWIFGWGAVLLLAACSSASANSLTGALDDGAEEAPMPTGPGEVAPAAGIPCDVDAVLKTRCQTCHGAEPKYGANTSLVTWADLQKPGPGANANKKIYELVKERIKDEARPMPPSQEPRLDPAEQAALEGWINAGAASTNAVCNGSGPEGGVKPLSCKPDTVLKASKPFTMEPGSPVDQYVCFGVDVPLEKKRHVVGLAPKVDNAQIVHHILLFQTDHSERSEPFACTASQSAEWKLVAGWAPGGNNLELPPEAGFPAEKGTTHWVLQIHYNNVKSKTGTDQSGYELCTTEHLREHDAGVLAFGSTAFAIPPRSSHTVSCDYPLGIGFKGVKVFNASPHMHAFGTAMKTERIPAGGGAPETILDQKTFSFEAQLNYPISKSLEQGDVVRTRCSWKNPTDAQIGFGEGTGDEMCFDFVGYYPAIPDQKFLGLPVFTWVTPSTNAFCTVQ